MNKKRTIKISIRFVRHMQMILFNFQLFVCLSNLNIQHYINILLIFLNEYTFIQQKCMKLINES